MDLNQLEHPIHSSLLALGNNQWSDILPQWEEFNAQDHRLTAGTLQTNISMALSCIQAQLWIQTMVSALIREGEAVYTIYPIIAFGINHNESVLYPTGPI